MNQQASIISRLLTPAHMPLHMEVQSARAQDASKRYPPIDTETFSDEIPVAQVSQQAGVDMNGTELSVEHL